jgi:hypothetical protein
MGGEVAKLFAMVSNSQVKPNLIVAVPMLTMLVTYIWTLADIGKTEEPSLRVTSERVRPPVDLPFE